jgi:hypothetical protein
MNLKGTDNLIEETSKNCWLNRFYLLSILTSLLFYFIYSEGVVNHIVFLNEVLDKLLEKI